MHNDQAQPRRVSGVGWSDGLGDLSALAPTSNPTTTGPTFPQFSVVRVMDSDHGVVIESEDHAPSAGKQRIDGFLISQLFRTRLLMLMPMFDDVFLASASRELIVTFPLPKS